MSDAMEDYPKFIELGEWAEKAQEEVDMINNPPHYTSHPSGVECIDVTRHLNFCLGNAVKYIWRAGLKDNAIEDLRKAKWYIDQELDRLLTSSSSA